MKIHQFIKNHTEEKSYNHTGGNCFALTLSKNFKITLSCAARRKFFKQKEYSLNTKTVRSVTLLTIFK